MLEQVLQNLNNWFVASVKDDKFEIKNNTITLPFLKGGQYFKIFGSVFNDGLYKYPAVDLTDEAFEGTIWALSIPKEVINLAEDIKAWADNNQPSALTSESFGGYSRSWATRADGAAAGWEVVFKPQLNRWRKIRESSYVAGRHPVRELGRPFNPDYPFGGGL